MNMISRLLVLVVLICSLGVVAPVSAGNFFDDLVDYKLKQNNPYQDICDKGDCLEEGVKQVRDLEGLETEKSASAYVQDVIAYLLQFTSFIVVIMIIYAGFLIITANGDEEKVKKAKMLVIYGIAGVMIIYLAGPIAKFLFEVFLPGGSNNV